MGFLKDNLWKALTFFLIAGFSLSRTIVIAEADSFWQIKSGQDFLVTGEFLMPDAYSWTAEGNEYLSNSWLWNVLMAGIYEVGAFIGVAIFTGLCSLTILGLLTFHLRSRGIKWGHIFAVVAFTSLFIAGWITARPQIFDYIFLLLGMIAVDRFRSSTFKTLGVLGILMILWNNFHLTGPVGAICFGGLYFMSQMTSAVDSTPKIFFQKLVSSMGVVGFLLFACLITPYGLQGMTKPFTTVASSTGLIAEWVSPWDFSEPANAISAVGLGIIFMVLIFLTTKRQWLEVLFIAGLFIIGSEQARWVPFAILLSAPYLCAVISALPYQIHQALKPYYKVVALAITLPVCALGMTTFFSGDRVSGGDYGYTLVNDVPVGCKVFNEQSFGGPLILLRSDTRVSMDGRNDLYGSEEYLRQLNIIHSVDSPQAWLDEHDVNCIFVREDSGINTPLFDLPEWEIRSRDANGAVLWVRQ